MLLFAQAATEVATQVSGENSALSWPVASVLIVLIGSVCLAVVTSLRSKHEFNRDVVRKRGE